MLPLHMNSQIMLIVVHAVAHITRPSSTRRTNKYLSGARRYPLKILQAIQPEEINMTGQGDLSSERYCSWTLEKSITRYLKKTRQFLTGSYVNTGYPPPSFRRPQVYHDFITSSLIPSCLVLLCLKTEYIFIHKVVFPKPKY